MAGPFVLVAMWAIAAVAGRDSDAAGQTARDGGVTLRRPHVVVVKSARRLHLFDGDRLVRSYPVSLGWQPAGDKRQLGDGRTPEGTFRICVKRSDSEHHRFLGIDYPDRNAARRGVTDGLLTTGEAAAIAAAHDALRCPPWTTGLGGGIGLHGCGSAGAGQRAAAGGSADWTAGCVAMSDAHIDELFRVLRLGDVVEILP